MTSLQCTKKEISLRTTFEQFGKMTLKSDFIIILKMNDYDSKAEQCRLCNAEYFSANNLAAAIVNDLRSMVPESKLFVLV